jgi:hypothetical protein
MQLPGKISSWEDALTPIEAGHKISKPQPLFHKVETDEAKLDEQLAAIRAKMAPK